jgi:phosphotriesterase-related protein
VGEGGGPTGERGDGRVAWTVLGPVATAKLGWTLPHEHIYVVNNFWNPDPSTALLRGLADTAVSLATLSRVRRWPLTVRDNGLLADEEVARAELDKARAEGIKTVVDLTNRGLGRDPAALQRVARLTGLNILCGCGYYMGLTHPPELATTSVDEVTEEIVGDLLDGIGDTGVCAGVIGEIGVSAAPEEGEKKVLRASARAARATGAPVFVHHVGVQGHDILDVLEEEDLSPGRIVMCHMDFRLDDPDGERYAESLAERGVYLEYDLFGSDVMWSETTGTPFPNDLTRVRMVRHLWDRGFGRQLLCSHDVCMKVQLQRYGGHGYSHLAETMVPVFRASGFTPEDLAELFVANPADILGWRSPESAGELRQSRRDQGDASFPRSDRSAEPGSLDRTDR